MSVTAVTDEMVRAAADAAKELRRRQKAGERVDGNVFAGLLLIDYGLLPPAAQARVRAELIEARPERAFSRLASCVRSLFKVGS